jgi:uncharacterized protein (TIGR01777 family)
MAKIVLTGGSGLIGRRLGNRLHEKGYEVVCLSRNKKQANGFQTYYWNVKKQWIDQAAMESAEYIIHLAGANIGEKRWTRLRRNEMLESRVGPMKLLADYVIRNNIPLKAFISASAIGYYGSLTTEKIFVESDPPSDDFLGELCRLWESAADPFMESGIRTVKIRTGMVLAKNGGALARIALPVKLGMGSDLGSGRQYLPWIHIDDLCSIYIKAIEDINMNGAYNAVAPDHKTYREFIKILAGLLRKPLWLPHIPAFFLRIILGRKADIVLKGSRISPDKLQKQGYQFMFGSLEAALRDIIRSPHQA